MTPPDEPNEHFHILDHSLGPGPFSAMRRAAEPTLIVRISRNSAPTPGACWFNKGTAMVIHAVQGHNNRGDAFVG